METNETATVETPAPSVPSTETEPPAAEPTLDGPKASSAIGPTTRCKFKVARRSRDDNGSPVLTVHAYPVYSTDPNSENKAFWDATPAGALQISVTRPEVLADFDTGVEFYVDLTPIKA